MGSTWQSRKVVSLDIYGATGDRVACPDLWLQYPGVWLRHKGAWVAVTAHAFVVQVEYSVFCFPSITAIMS